MYYAVFPGVVEPEGAKTDRRIKKALVPGGPEFLCFNAGVDPSPVFPAFPTAGGADIVSQGNILRTAKAKKVVGFKVIDAVSL